MCALCDVLSASNSPYKARVSQQTMTFVILPLILVHQRVRECAVVSVDRHGSERKNPQENDKNPN